MEAYEKRRGIKFACLTYHDSEDIVHPLELKLANYVVGNGNKDLMQIPVVPLTSNPWNFNGTYYQDEFIEIGFKDMIVRESISGYVPSCGVATSFSPDAIQTLSRLNNGVVFNTKSLTEDYYDIGYRLLNEGLKYILYRDRKAVFTHPANLFAYIILVNLIGLSLSHMLDKTSWHFPEFMPEGSWIWILVYFNALFLASRLFHRFYFVNKHYGLLQAFLSLPRLVWGNFVNMFALFRAYKRYRFAGQEKKEVKWNKTDREFPDEVEIAKVA